MERNIRPIAIIVTATVFGLLITAVGVTLLIAPSALKWRDSRRASREEAKVVRTAARTAPPDARWHPRQNLAPLAMVTVSSTSHAAESDKIDAGVADGTPDGREWVTQGEAGGAWVKLNWEYPVSVVEVTLYDRSSKEDNILAGTLIFDDQSAVSVPALPALGAAWTVRFPAKVVRSVTFRIDQVEGKNAGLAEIMVFGSAAP